MNTLVEKLLQPISATAPCGPDLSYDPRFDELEALLKGQPEVEMGSIVKPAEPPDWNRLKDRSIEFASASKHLRPLAILTCSLLQVDGLAGFRDGLQLVRGLLEQYWSSIHPQVDPEDTEDPYQQRLSNLSALTAPRGSVDGWLRIVDYLYVTPIARPKGVAPVTLEEVLAAHDSKPLAEGEAAKTVGPAQLATKFRSAKPEELLATHETVVQALEAIAGIDKFLSSTLGASGSISFEEVTQVLTQIQKTLASHLPGVPALAHVPAPGQDAAESAPGARSAGPSFSGSIQSRDDVNRALESICEYYRQAEPGSPVPFLLRRAQKLVSMNFLDAMKELSLANLDQLRPIMGSALDSASGSEAPAEPAPTS